MVNQGPGSSTIFVGDQLQWQPKCSKCGKVMYSTCHDLYTCVIMTPLIVLIHNGFITNESHDLWYDEQYFNESEFHYLFSNHQALTNYLNRFLPQVKEPPEGRKKAMVNATRLNLNSIIKCKFSSAHNIDMSDNNETDVYKRNMYNFIVANKEDSGHLVLQGNSKYMVKNTNTIYVMQPRNECPSVLIVQQ